MMDWKELFLMQEQLDKYIESNHDFTGHDMFEERYLALLVELGELANETRCFKFWSTKPSSERTVILEEYVDGIHFILSLGIEKGHRYQPKQVHISQQTKTEQFNEVFDACVLFKNNPIELNYESLFTKFLQLGDKLGFSEHDIQEAYFKKNEINYQRQDKGY